MSLIGRACAVLLMVSVVALASAKTVLGKLGQSVADTVIFARPSVRAHKLYHLQPYEYLVVNSCRYHGWLRISMSNGQPGYVAEAAVAQLPYQVTSSDIHRAAVQPAFSIPTAADGARAAIAGYAVSYTGSRYKWGGTDPLTGADCSGFVKAMFGKIGVSLPRTAAEQANVGTPIERLEELKAGDRLYFWDKHRGKIGHTGIYLGSGYFVHDSSSHRGVATDFILDPHWHNMLAAARR